MADKDSQANQITQMLRDLSDSQRSDSDESLLRLVYDELRRQAHRYLQKERRGHTLQTTALVHEAYLKLIQQKGVAWQSRSQFFGVAEIGRASCRDTVYCEAGDVPRALYR